MIPAERFSAGEYLADEMKARRLSVMTVAKVLEMSETSVREIMDGRRRISRTAAGRLARLLGTTAELWMNLDAGKGRNA